MSYEGSYTGSLVRSDGSVIRLYNSTENEAQSRNMLINDLEVCRTTKSYAIYLSKMQDESHLALFEAETGHIGYFVQCKPVTVCGIKATQVVGWRDGDCFAAFGMTNPIFLGILVPRFGMLVSDPQIGRDAETFWHQLQALAFSQDHRVGVIRKDATEVDWIRQGQDYRCWSPPQPHIEADKNLDGIRYVISKKFENSC